MANNQTVTVYGNDLPTFMQQVPKSQRKPLFGMKMPFGYRKTTGGFLAKNSGVDLFKDAIKQVLLTEKGERLMLPGFGCNLRKFLFHPLDEQLFESIKREVSDALNKYVIGAELIKIRVIPLGDIGPSGGNSLKISLDCRVLKGDEVFGVEVAIS